MLLQWLAVGLPALVQMSLHTLWNHAGGDVPDTSSFNSLVNRRMFCLLMIAFFFSGSTQLPSGSPLLWIRVSLKSANLMQTESSLCFSISQSNFCIFYKTTKSVIICERLMQNVHLGNSVDSKFKGCRKFEMNEDKIAYFLLIGEVYQSILVLVRVG